MIGLKKISVIIPTYNEEKNIILTLKSLMTQTLSRDEYEIIIVDGGSTDKTVSLAEKYADKVIQQVSEGIGGARNDGAKIAKGEYLATTDADTIIPKHWLSRIIDDFGHMKNVVAVSGPIYPREWTPFNKFFFLMGYYNLPKILLKISPRLNFLTFGPNSAFRKDAFFKAGGYSNLGIVDDVEIVRRIKKYGRIYYDFKLIVYASARRFKKDGYFRTTLFQDFTSVRLLLFNKEKVEYKGYAKKKYD